MGLIATFALLALFSIVAIVMSAEGTWEERDPRDNPLYWIALGRH